MNIKKILSSVGIVTVAVILGLGIQYVLADWTPAPVSGPPNDNVPAPINVGSSPQAKVGGLSIGTATLPSGGVSAYIQGILQATSILTNIFQLNDGSNNDTGKVLQSSNATGLAQWVATSTLGLGGNNGNNGNNGSGIPSGAIMAFDLASCPGGWTEYMNARGRTIVGSGVSVNKDMNNVNLTTRALDTTGGEEKHTLTVSQLPPFSVTSNFPYSFTISLPADTSGMYSAGHGVADGSITLTSNSVGGGQAHSIMQPYIAQLYCEKD
jgi:hypothetical protein